MVEAAALALCLIVMRTCTCHSSSTHNQSQLDWDTHPVARRWALSAKAWVAHALPERALASDIFPATTGDTAFDDVTQRAATAVTRLAQSILATPRSPEKVIQCVRAVAPAPVTLACACVRVSVSCLSQCACHTVCWTQLRHSCHHRAARVQVLRQCMQIGQT